MSSIKEGKIQKRKTITKYCNIQSGPMQKNPNEWVTLGYAHQKLTIQNNYPKKKRWLKKGNLLSIKIINKREKLRQLTSYLTLKLLENGSLEDGVKFICNVHPIIIWKSKQLEHYEPPLHIHPRLPHQTNETTSEQRKHHETKSIKLHVHQLVQDLTHHNDFQKA
jgi:hypothetical protein